jgi:Carboxypeptidase regulatory-like domain
MKQLCVLSLIVVVVTCSVVFSQTYSGAMHGTVVDQVGAVVSGAEVSAKNTATGVVRTTRTAANGEYLLPDLTIGVYNVVVRAHGFKDLNKPSQVKNQDSLMLNFKLQDAKSRP